MGKNSQVIQGAMGQRIEEEKTKVFQNRPYTGSLDFLSLLFISFLFFFFAGADPTHEGTAEGMENMADAVTHARFVGTDPASDEVVLMKILQVNGGGQQLG